LDEKRKTSNRRNYRIALDAMGGDFAPINEVLGVIKAFESKLGGFNAEIVLVGDEDKIRKKLNQYDTSILNYSIVHAPDVVTMHDEPSMVLKNKRNSSMFIGVELLAKRYVDAFVSAGNTGAVLATSTILLGRIPGVSRPTIGTFFPTKNKYPSLVLDVGANVDVKPRYLYEFAVMGSIATTQMYGIENPSVGLLNIGEEESKGTDVLRQTHKMLKESQLNFIGNIEGKDILSGISDVIVCDGFTGNVLLKFAEGFYSLIKSKIKSMGNGNVLNKAMVLLAAPALKKMFKDFNYENYGGVPLLGVNGAVIIGHGKSSPEAVKNMIYKAYELVDKNVNEKIVNALNPTLVTSNVE